MRPLHVLILILGFLTAVDTGLIFYQHQAVRQHARFMQASKILVSGLGLSDLSVSTEARYTRHPAVSDSVVPFMDHPGAIEHFPSGSFWTPTANNNIRVK